MKKIMMTIALLLSSAATFAGAIDVSCNQGLFSIVREAPQGGYVFDFKAEGHLLDHLIDNGVLDQIEISSDLTLGRHEPTYRGETPLSLKLVNGKTIYLEKDYNSAGYFLRVKGSSVEYYFNQCDFGRTFRM